MGITTEINKEYKLRIHHVEGALAFDELMSKLKEIYATPDFDSEMDVLWDLRKTDLTAFFSSDIQKVRDFVSIHWGAKGKSRAALVVSRDLEFGLSRMYEFFLEAKTTNEVQVFRDYNEALDWITT